MMPSHAESRRETRALETPAEPQRIGAILLEMGKITAYEAEQILRLQKEKGLRFGEAAQALGLLSQEDIQKALARQFDYPYLAPGEGKIGEELVAAHQPFSSQVDSFRVLRTQLLFRYFGPEHRTLALVSPGTKDGRSYFAANLAVVFSQLGERTLLIDADLRAPRQHHIFGLSNAMGLSEVLSNRAGRHEVIHSLAGFRNLSILPAGAIPPNPLELLSRPALQTLLDACAWDYEIVLIDTPAANNNSDAQAIASRAKACLMLLRRDRTRMKDAAELASLLEGAHSRVVGTVLNEF